MKFLRWCLSVPLALASGICAVLQLLFMGFAALGLVGADAFDWVSKRLLAKAEKLGY